MVNLNEKLEKNFNGNPFKLSIPILSVFKDKIILTTTLSFREKTPYGVVFVAARLTGGFGREYESNTEKCYFSAKKLNEELVVTIPTQDKQPLMREAIIKLCFLNHDGRKINVVYQSDKTSKLTFLGVQSDVMSETEKDVYVTCFQNDLHVESMSDKEIAEEKNVGEMEYRNIPSLEKYQDALRKEMHFLRNQGGRKYKVSSGKQVSTLHGRYYYSFELETELFLSDDAPLRLITGGREADGNVLVCEGFQIIVVIDKDFGEKIATAEISVEPWKLLEALQKKIAQLSRADGIATKLIEEGPRLGSKRPYTDIPKGQSNVKEHMKNNDITVVWGPPGTGKSYTMAEIALSYMEMGKKVLMVSHSNISVDGVVGQLGTILTESGKTSFMEEGRILRYGYVRDEELADNENLVSFNFALKNCMELKRKMEALLEEKHILQRSNTPFNNRRVEIEREIKAIRTSIRQTERAKVNAAQMVATTISKVTVDPLFEEKHFDIVMFDEVSMAYVLQLVCAAMYAKEHFLCVGDFMQLAPIAQSSEKRTLETDIFEYLHITDGTNIYAHPWLVMLNEQRRMYPDISAFSNKKVYHRLLTDHEKVVEREEIINRIPLSGNAMNFVDLTGTCCSAYSNKDNSHFNILSAIVSFSTALTAELNGEESIGIITPYAAQARLIKAMIQDYRKYKETNIACVTVHQFQGSQRNVIIFDMVESFPFSKPGLLTSNMENNSVTRLVNVAVTRARGKLVSIANHSFWNRKLHGSQNLFYQLQKHIKENNNVVSTETKTLQGFIPELASGKNIHFYDEKVNLLDAIKGLQKDIEKAESRIIVSLPSGKLIEEISNDILQSLRDSKKRGIQILMKSREYEVLPKEWQDFCYQSTNAVFPLIAIDNKVIWYGLPLAKWLFQDGDAGFGTVYPMIYRIKGEHTVELIHTLTNLEMKEVDGKEKALQEKTDDTIADGLSDAGFPEYVKSNFKCPSCKTPLEVLRNQRKVCYLRCGNRKECNNIDYVREDMVNGYIWNEHARCPKHKSEIYAKRGPHGVYVVCEKGGHYLKPDEI